MLKLEAAFTDSKRGIWFVERGMERVVCILAVLCEYAADDGSIRASVKRALRKLRGCLMLVDKS